MRIDVKCVGRLIPTYELETKPLKAVISVVSLD